MPSKFYSYLHLIRLAKPVGVMLAFYPACFGLFLAAEQIEHLLYIPLLLIGSFIARSAGCIINDICDHKFDIYVERTKTRPIAAGVVSIKEAMLILLILLIAGLGLLLTLNITAIIIGILAFCLMCIYPLMKRVTNYPQLFLGICFNLGALIGYSCVADTINFSSIILYIACGFWTVGYDTIYGFMDIRDDKKIGVKSLAIVLENRNYTAYISIFYFTFFALFILANFYSNNALTMICAGILFVVFYIYISNLDVHSTLKCQYFFNNNNRLGLVLSVTLMFDFLMKIKVFS